MYILTLSSLAVKSEDCSTLEKSEARMKLFPLFFLLLAFFSPPASFSGEGELCDICIDLVRPPYQMMTMVTMMVMQVTLLEEWITDETTADEIAAFVEQFCSQLGPLASVCEVPSPLICFSEQCVMCPLTKGFVVLCCEANKVGRQFFGQTNDTRSS